MAMPVMRLSRRPLWVTALALAVGLVFPGVAGAEAVQDPPPVAGATLETTTAIESANHRILLSPLREVRNEVRADRQIRLAVKGTGSLYRLDQDTSLGRARQQYRASLLKKGARIIFECTGLSCGPSNTWANEVFHQATLYGPDEGQGVSVAAFRNNAGFLQLWVSYTIRRGNERKYLWLERLGIDSAAGIPGIDLKPQRLRGPVIVPWAGIVTQHFDWSQKTRDQVVAWASDPDAALVLTTHSGLKPDESLSESFARAGEAGSTMQALLAKLGVPRTKQVLINNGPALAHSDDALRRGNRIEIVVIRNAGSIDDL